MPDCGDNSCRYRTEKRGVRTNGGCRCDTCPECGCRGCRPGSPKRHHSCCTQPEWLPEHHRATEDKERP